MYLAWSTRLLSERKTAGCALTRPTSKDCGFSVAPDPISCSSLAAHSAPASIPPSVNCFRGLRFSQDERFRRCTRRRQKPEVAPTWSVRLLFAMVDDGCHLRRPSRRQDPTELLSVFHRSGTWATRRRSEDIYMACDASTASFRSAAT